MEAIVQTVAEFATWVDDQPHLLDLPTREVMNLMRQRLDERHPGWREAVFAEFGPEANRVEVEMPFPDRTIRGAILQRPTAPE